MLQGTNDRISRKMARILGLKRYFTARPCPNGHTTERYVSAGTCCACARENASDWREKYPEKYLAAQRDWAKNNRDKTSVWGQAWRELNIEKSRAFARKWAANNKSKTNANTTAYRLRKKNRLPLWADLEAIGFFYECRPAGCHVDHIIPLCGKNISGLHVAENLQWLPEKENLVKSNKYTGRFNAS